MTAVDQTAHPGQNRLLGALPPSELQQLVRSLELVELALYQVLIAPDQPITAVYFPISGLVSLVALTEAGGRAVAVELVGIGREGIVGLSVAQSVRQSSVRARCQLPGRAYRMPLTAFWEHQATLPGFQRQIWRYAQFALMRLGNLAVCNLLHSLTQRCARWLLDAHDHAERNSFRMTHEVLAEMLGTQRSSVTGAVRRLADRGMLDYRWGNLTIVDREGLEAASCDCYAQIRGDYERLFAG